MLQPRRVVSDADVTCSNFTSVNGCSPVHMYSSANPETNRVVLENARSRWQRHPAGAVCPTPIFLRFGAEFDHAMGIMQPEQCSRDVFVFVHQKGNC